MDTHELAWAAGFFDGEGCVSYPPSNRSIRLQLGQAGPPELLERFRSAVGGIGVIAKMTEQPNRKPAWVWRISRFEHSQAVIAFLWPWLGPVKRGAARAALSEKNAAVRERGWVKGSDPCEPDCTCGRHRGRRRSATGQFV